MNAADKKTAGCIVILFFFVFLFFADVVFTSETFVVRDNYRFFNPRRFFAAECVRQGELPLWNPYLACGVPFMANLQSSVLYPLSALYYVLPFQKGFKYFIVLHYCIGALAMFLLMRQWGADRYASVLSGMVFSLGGYMVSINENIAFLTAGVWLPLVLASHHCALKSGKNLYAVFTGVLLAIQIFAGDASFFLASTLGCLALYTVFWPLLNQSGVTVWKGLLYFFESVLIGILTASVQLIPFAEFVLHSTRFEGLSFELISKWSSHPGELLALFVPFPFGTLVPNTRWFGQSWLDTWYVGIFPLFFSIIFLIAARDRRKWFFISVAGLSLFLALGKYNPLFYYLYLLLPGADMLLYPVKFLFLAHVAFAVTAGFGMQLLLSNTSTASRMRLAVRCIVGLCAAMVAALLGLCFFEPELEGWMRTAYPLTQYNSLFRNTLITVLSRGGATAVVLAVFFGVFAVFVTRYSPRKKYVAGCVLFVVFADLYLIGKPPDILLEESKMTEPPVTVDFLEQDRSSFRIYSHQTSESYMHLYGTSFDHIYAQMKKMFFPNINMYYHICSVQEHSALLNRRFYDVIMPAVQVLNAKDPVAAEMSYVKKIFDLFNVKYVLSPVLLPQLSYPQKRINTGIHLYENPNVLPRFYFAPRIVVCKDDTAVLNRMQSPGFNPHESALITEANADTISSHLSHSRGLNISAENKTVCRTYTPKRVVLDVSIQTPGLLVMSESYYPGWRAYVDGRPVPVIRVNYVLRGIPVPPGRHTVSVMYRPYSFATGAFVSCFFLVIAVVLPAFSWKKGRYRSTCSGGEGRAVR